MEIIIQDGITYKVDNGVIKGWFGQSPFLKPTYDNGVIVEGWTQADTDEQLSDAKDLKLDELHVIVNKELEDLQGLINDNQILVTIGRNEKPIPQQAKNWASSVLDQQEDIENEINALTTLEEVQNYQIIIE